MKKTRLLALLCAFLMLLSLPLIACSEEPTQSPDQNPSQSPAPTPGGGNDDAANMGEPNTDPDYDPTKDPGLFLSTNGYPMDFKVVFTKDGYGFDTASNTILNGSDSCSYTFTGEDFRDLYRIFDNCNLWSLPLDLTYSRLTGNSAGEPVAVFALTVSTAEQESRTYRIDSASIARLANDPNVSNLGAAVTELEACTAMYAEKAKN